MSSEKKSKKESGASFRPFQEAANILQDIKPAPQPKKKPQPKVTPTKPVATKQPEPEPPQERCDEFLLEEAYANVKPLAANDRQRVSPPPPKQGTGKHFDEDMEALAHLEGLVDGNLHFDPFPYSDEYVEWAADDATPDIKKRLASGEFPLENDFDLHGMTRREAREAIETYLTKCMRLSQSCVLVVHGRGNRSPDGIGVLRRALHFWLRKGALSKQILAFTTALAIDGGSGATYILLRKSY